MPLPLPRGRQREVLYLPATGHVAVLGTAGSGKTTLAIHRAVHLADTALEHGGPTLLLTFNKTLVTYLRHLGGNELGNVTVENYHRFARGYLASRGKMNGWIAQSERREALIDAAIASVAATADAALLKRGVTFFSEEIRWIGRNQVRTAADYVAATRTGRLDARVERKDRELMWRVYEAYLHLRQPQYIYDWDDIAGAVFDELAVDDGPRMYRHVVIDEGQDFSPAMLRSLVRAVPQDGSVTFFGDVAQQIFGRRMSWRSAGLQIAKPWMFEDNYRNTKQIARLAVAISKMPYYRDEVDLIEPHAPAADGPLPTKVQFNDLGEEISFIMKQACAAAASQSVAILVRRREHEGLFEHLLPKGSVRLDGKMKKWLTGPRIHYGTYHAAKGLEFDMVILPLFGTDSMPDPQEIEDFGLEEATAQDGRLLYVGVTRARTYLIFTHTGDLSTLIPNEPGLMGTGDAKS